MKKQFDDVNGRNLNEKELFYGCPLSMARNILQNGFDYDTDRIHGKFDQTLIISIIKDIVILGDKYGKGFYFSSERNLCEKYTVPDEFKNDQKALIKCRIRINEDNSNIFVVSRNEQILPEYLIIYNK